MSEERKNPDYAKPHNTIIGLATEVIDVQKHFHDQQRQKQEIVMPFMRLSDEEKMWLREQCVEPIIHSAIERIDFYDNFTAIADNEPIVIEAAFYFVINKFATYGIELFLLDDEYDYEAFLNDLLKAIEINEDLDTDSLHEWNDLIVKIQHYCFREMQALQIVKLEYSSLPKEELEEKIISTINEEFNPPWEIERMQTEDELHRYIAEKEELDEKCRTMQNSLMPF